ncbi:hypothetical protein D3C85_1904240 [compost metagenome]
MHDLVAHIDGGAELLNGALDDLNRAVYTRAKATRFGQQNLLGFLHHRIPISCTSNVTG